MLAKLSPRQKARGALSVLGLSQDETKSLDTLVADTLGNPIVGAVVGIDAVSLEELATVFFSNEKSFDVSMFDGFRAKLTETRFRASVGGAIMKVLRALPKEHQQHAVNVIKRLSEMDFPELNGEFEDVQHFITDGVLVLIANKTTKTQTDVDIFVCPDCGHVSNI